MKVFESNRKAYHAAWYLAHREEQRAWSMEYRKLPEVKEQARRQQRRWRQENKEARLFAKKLGVRIGEARRIMAEMDEKRRMKHDVEMGKGASSVGAGRADAHRD